MDSHKALHMAKEVIGSGEVGKAPLDARGNSSSNVLDVCGRTAGGVAAVLAAISYLWGTEPVLTGALWRNREVPDFTFDQFRDAGIERNGDTLGNNVMATIAYPGAQLGRIAANAIIEE